MSLIWIIYILLCVSLSCLCLIKTLLKIILQRNHEQWSSCCFGRKGDEDRSGWDGRRERGKEKVHALWWVWAECFGVAMLASVLLHGLCDPWILSSRWSLPCVWCHHKSSGPYQYHLRCIRLWLFVWRLFISRILCLWCTLRRLFVFNV